MKKEATEGDGNSMIKPLTPRKKYRKRPDTRARELAFMSLISSGIKPSKASEMLGFSPGTGSRIAARLREQGNEIPTLVSIARTEKVQRVMDRILDSGVKMQKFKGSDVTNTVKMYLDRSNPVRQDVGRPEVSFVKMVDISVYRTDREIEQVGSHEEPQGDLRDVEET